MTTSGIGVPGGARARSPRRGLVRWTRLRTAAAASLAFVSLWPAGASATAPVSERRYGGVSFDIRGTDGVWYHAQVMGFAASPTHPAVVSVRVWRCTGCNPLFSSILILPAAAVTVAPDLATATVAANVGGMRVRVAWERDELPAPGFQLYNDMTMQAGPQAGAVARVEVFGATCVVRTNTVNGAWVGHGVYVGPHPESSSPSRAPLPRALRPTPASKPRC